MKYYSASKVPGRKSTRGVALVVVLGMLVLVLVLVVAFLSSVSVELQSAKKYSGGADARTLADSATSLVIAQIQDATAKPQLAWASQPGMIRTYDDSGNMVTAYKLYSSDVLREGAAYNPVTRFSSEIPADWASRTGLYTDLNKPVTVSGTNHYPVIDPSAVGMEVSGGAPLEGSLPAIEGCFLDSTKSVAAGQSNKLPMPVQWLYVLKSGTLAAMDGAGKVKGAGQADPIVGRIAFWTDDETSKININTASEGTYWDRPWTTGVDPTGYERKLSTSMPVQNEFQRFPGHPAMTSLSTVFPSFAASTDTKEMLYDIVPRVSGGGSKQGTAPINQKSAPIVGDNYRLFASVDEFYFTATNLVNGTRVANENGLNGTFNVSDIDRTRFFLTANSRAPEVNLFNKPRVGLWPLQANPSNVNDPVASPYRGAKDRLIAFCSTVGNVPYYFQRYNVYTSPTQDPIPSSQSPTMDWTEIPRNQTLYKYLQTLTGRPIPGFGGSFLMKYPDTRDQILTEMVDLMRSGVNTFSTAETPNYFYTPFDPTGFVKGQGQVVPLEPPIGTPGAGTKGFGRFQTVTEAAMILYTKSRLTISGSMPANGQIVSGTSPPIIFGSGTYLDKYPLGNVAGGTAIKITGTAYKLDFEEPEPRTFGAVLVLEPFNPTPGIPPWTANVRYAITGLDTLNLGFPSDTLVNLVESIDSTNNATSQTGLETNLQRPPRTPKTLGATVKEEPDNRFYPFFGEFTASGTTMNFTGGTIEIEIYQGTVRPLAAADSVQKIHMIFPPVDKLQLPQTASRSVGSGTTTVTVFDPNHDNWRDYDNRLSRIVSSANLTKGRWGIAEDGQHRPLPLVIGNTAFPYLGDTVRSVEARYGGPARGDYRMIAGVKDVPESYFEGHGLKDAFVQGGTLYSGTTVGSRLVHSLTIDHMQGSGDTGSSNGFYAGAGSASDPRGKLVKTNYNDPRRGDSARNSTRPVAPRGLEEALMLNGAPGDWDNGLGTVSDGPYINYPDQASANTTQASTLYYAKGGYINASGVVENGAAFSPNRQISSAVAFGSLPTGINPTDPSKCAPWQTLLFGRHPAAGTVHPGFGTPLLTPPYTLPPDHLLLDLFTMPIVEPYAISEPFSTAGKVNMNYQIVPFLYLKRTTGMRAVLKATNMMAIPTSDGDKYKWTANSPPDYRYSIDPNESTGTLSGFEHRFNGGDIFRSASEICDISLVPKQRVDGSPVSGGPTYAGMDLWWNNYKLTGDNVREGPYGHLYPRLTTKSNTYTVHVQAQSISKALGTVADEFVEGKDQVSGEFRGSFLIERYLDPNADSLVLEDGSRATDENAPDTMVGPYKFRVISTKKFAP